MLSNHYFNIVLQAPSSRSLEVCYTCWVRARRQVARHGGQQPQIPQSSPSEAVIAPLLIPPSLPTPPPFPIPPPLPVEASLPARSERPHTVNIPHSSWCSSGWY